MKNMKKNIVIVGFNYEYNIEIAQGVSDFFDMYFLDVDKFIEYQLQQKPVMAEVCGVEYLEKQENKVLKSCTEFENTVMTIPINYFLRNKIYKNFAESEIIYLYFSKNKLEKLCENNNTSSFLLTDIITFEEKDNEIKSITNAKIEIKNKNKDTVLCEIKKYLEGTCEH